MIENRLIVCFGPLNQWRFARESLLNEIDISTPGFLNARHNLGPPGSATIAYSTTDDGKVGRVWWLCRPVTWDGIDVHPLDAIPKVPLPFTVVDPQSIALNEPSKPFKPWTALSYSHRLTEIPKRLAERWEQWESRYAPRVIWPEPPPPPPPPPQPTPWQKFVSYFKRKIFHVQ